MYYWVVYKPPLQVSLESKWWVVDCVLSSNLICINWRILAKKDRQRDDLFYDMTYGILKSNILEIVYLGEGLGIDISVTVGIVICNTYNISSFLHIGKNVIF